MILFSKDANQHVEEYYSTAYAKMAKYFMNLKNANINSNLLFTDATWYYNNIERAGFIITDGKLDFLATRCCKLEAETILEVEIQAMFQGLLCAKDMKIKIGHAFTSCVELHLNP